MTPSRVLNIKRRVSLTGRQTSRAEHRRSTSNTNTHHAAQRCTPAHGSGREELPLGHPQSWCALGTNGARAAAQSRRQEVRASLASLGAARPAKGDGEIFQVSVVSEHCRLPWANADLPAQLAEGASARPPTAHWLPRGHSSSRIQRSGGTPGTECEAGAEDRWPIYSQGLHGAPWEGIFQTGIGLGSFARRSFTRPMRILPQELVSLG